MVETTISVENVTDEEKTSFLKTVTDCLDSYSSEVSIYDYLFSADVAKVFINAFFAKNSEYFYISSWEVTYLNDDFKTAYSFKVVYYDNASDMINTVSQIADEIISGIDESMTDIEKAVYVHDYLVLNYIYDADIAESPWELLSYDFFIQKSGNSNQIARAYQYLMQYKLNFPVILVWSSSMNLAWNMIQINGNWYHVDVFWDYHDTENNWDIYVPFYKFYKIAEHSTFLKSNSGMYNNDHYGWDFAENFFKTESSSFWIEANDTTYDHIK